MHRRTLIIPVAVIALLAACGSDDDTATDTAGSSTTDATTATTVETADSIRTGDEQPPESTTTELLADPTDDKAPTVTTSPNPSDEPTYEEGDIDPGLQPFTDVAIADLADRLDVAASAITTHAAVLVVWPDTSLGCPAPDMVYTPVLTDGSAIELRHAELYYRYHTGGEAGPFFCEPGGAASAPSIGDLFAVPDEDT